MKNKINLILGLVALSALTVSSEYLVKQNTGVQSEDFSQSESNTPSSNASCKAILEGNTSSTSGIYDLNVEGQDIQTYCNMDFDGGGWTLIAVRQPSATGYLGTDSITSYNLNDNTYLNLGNALSNSSTEMYYSRGVENSYYMKLNLTNMLDTSSSYNDCETYDISKTGSFFWVESSGCTKSGSDYMYLGYSSSQNSRPVVVPSTMQNHYVLECGTGYQNGGHCKDSSTAQIGVVFVR